MQGIRIDLPIEELPTKWYNALPDLPAILPEPKDPADGTPTIENNRRIRPAVLNEQDNSAKRWETIPGEVLEAYLRIGRPTPLQRAVSLERHLGTPAKIFFKREDVLPTGSFKLNSAIAQAYYAKQDGFEALISETGAGQWGTAVCIAAQSYGLGAKIFMARVSYEQKPYRRYFMKLCGGEVHPSPSNLTQSGKSFLLSDPQHPGSIGTGISEAIETALAHQGKYAYVSGSNLPHVLMHQTIIGLETKKQLAMAGLKPDTLICCVGGGSNCGGLMLPFLPEKLKDPDSLQFLAAESDSVPRLTKGVYEYGAGDASGLTPLTKSYTLGQGFVPPRIHVGGLRQHNGSPLVGLLRKEGLLDATALSQEEAFQAGRLFSLCEGILPAPESCHAIKAAIDSALEAKEEGEERVIVFCLSGNGFFDLAGYEAILFKEGHQC